MEPDRVHGKFMEFDNYAWAPGGGCTGCGPAASVWEAGYSEMLKALGMVKRVANPTAFYNPEKEMRCVVHGDDFTFLR